MGIDNIHILIQPNDDHLNQHSQSLAAQQAKLVAEHRKGLHPYGMMRRACPLCQAS